MKASEAIVALNQQLADIGEQRFNVGDISELDYNLVLAEKEQSEAENFVMRQQVESARFSLNRRVGREIDSPTIATPETSIVKYSLDEERLIDLALTQRSDFAATGFMAKAAGRSLSKSWLNLIPNPVVSATWLTGTSIFDVSNPAGGSDTIIDRDKSFAKASSIESWLPFPTGLEVEYESGSDKRFANEGERDKTFSLSQEIEWPIPYLLRRSIASLNLQMREAEIRRQETLTRTEVADAFFFAVGGTGKIEGFRSDCGTKSTAR